MVLKNKILLFNVFLIMVVLIFQEPISNYLQNLMIIFTITLIYPFFSSMMVFYKNQSMILQIITPLLCLVIAYFIFWQGSEFITLSKLFIGSIGGMIHFFLQIKIFKNYFHN